MSGLSNTLQSQMTEQKAFPVHPGLSRTYTQVNSLSWTSANTFQNKERNKRTERREGEREGERGVGGMEGGRKGKRELERGGGRQGKIKPWWGEREKKRKKIKSKERHKSRDSTTRH